MDGWLWYAPGRVNWAGSYTRSGASKSSSSFAALASLKLG